jgi:hypothetical protein
MKWLKIMLVPALLVVAPGYSSGEQSAPKAVSPAAQAQDVGAKGEPGQSVKNYTPKERKAYEKKVTADLADLRQRISDLQGKYETAKPQMKRTTLKVLHGLTKQLAAAQNQLAALEKASAKDWGGLQVKMDKAMQDLTTACQEAESLLQ